MKTRHPKLTPAQLFFSEWLCGTTCSTKVPDKRSIHWQSKCGRFVVLKHAGHSEYTGRMSGTGWCGTYYRMYDVTKKQPRGIFGEPSLLSVDGRWTATHQRQAEAMIAEYKEQENG